MTNNTNLFSDLNITYNVELDEWTDYSRDKMTKEKCFGKFLENKMHIMLKKALTIYYFIKNYIDVCNKSNWKI